MFRLEATRIEAFALHPVRPKSGGLLSLPLQFHSCHERVHFGGCKWIKQDSVGLPSDLLSLAGVGNRHDDNTGYRGR